MAKKITKLGVAALQADLDQEWERVKELITRTGSRKLEYMLETLSGGDTDELIHAMRGDQNFASAICVLADLALTQAIANMGHHLTAIHEERGGKDVSGQA